MCFRIFVRNFSRAYINYTYVEKLGQSCTRGRVVEGLNGTVDNNLFATRMGCVRLIYIGLHNSLPVLCRRPLRRVWQTNVYGCKMPTYAGKYARGSGTDTGWGAIPILLMGRVHPDLIAPISIRVRDHPFSSGKDEGGGDTFSPFLRDLVRPSRKSVRDKNAGFLVSLSVWIFFLNPHLCQ